LHTLVQGNQLYEYKWHHDRPFRPSAARAGRVRSRSNDAARRLFVGWLDGEEPNLLRYVFLNPIARQVIPDWMERARRVLAEFRAESSRRLDDSALVALVDDLRTRSDFFARCWDEHEVVVPLGGERAFEPPRDGRLLYEQIAFTLASRVDLKLVMLIGR